MADIQGSLLENLLFTSKQAVFWKDLKGYYDGANDTFAHLMCFNHAHEIRGLTDNELLWTPEQIKENIQAEQQVALTGKSIEHNFRPLKRSRDDDTEISYSLFPLLDDQGNVQGIMGVIDQITPEKNMHDTLRRSEERLKLATQAANVGVWDFDLTQDTLIWDDVMYELYGVDRNDFSGAYEAWASTIHPEDFLRVNEELSQAISQRLPFETEFRVIWPDKSVHCLRALAKIRQSDTGTSIRMIGTNWDVTDQRKMEESLRFTQFAMDHANDCAFWVNENGTFVYVNEAACLCTDYTRQSLLEMSVMQIDSDCSNYRWQEIWGKLQERKHMTFESTIRTRTGGIIPVEIQANYIEYAGKRYNCSFVRNLTQKKKQEAELNRLAAAIHQAAEAVVITNKDGSIVYVNPAFTTTTGYSREEAIGRKPNLLKSGQHERHFYDELWATICSGKTWQGIFTNKKRCGEIYYEEATISPVYDAGGNLENFVAVRRDITKERQMEEQYRQAQKMESVGQLAGGVAHDLNNLLTPILGYSEMLLSGASLDEDASHAIEQIGKAGGRARDLVRQLLAFGRKQTLRTTAVNLNEIITSFQKLLKRTIRENVVIKTVLTSGLPMISVDSGQIEQVIMNLAVNAQDAMLEGGKLLIGTEKAYLNATYADNHQDCIPGHYVMLSVSDNGTGMDSSTQRRVFEPFFTTKVMGKGTGLGLATVYGIVRQHKGHIGVYSEPGEGTTFKLYFPIIKNREQRELQPAAKQTTKKNGSEHIVIIEDDHLVRELAESILNVYGYQVTTFHEGLLAQEYLTSTDHHIDLLLSDVIMPDINGKVVARTAKERFPDLKVIFMSGYTSSYIDDNDSYKHHDCSFIQKPFSMNDMVVRIREILDTQTELLEQTGRD